MFVNRIPVLTTIGKSYVFDDIDPSNQADATTYFDSIFPFVKDDYGNILEVDTSTWFTESDTGQTLTY